jgi:hypothetical protein
MAEPTANERKATVCLAVIELRKCKAFQGYYLGKLRAMQAALDMRILTDLSTQGEALQQARVERNLLAEIIKMPERDFEINSLDRD